MEAIKKELHRQSLHNLNLKPISSGKVQVWLPVYYEDGDMIDIYVETMDDGHYQITDSGMTIMKLSYNYEINTDNKKKILNHIIESNGLSLENGTLCRDVSKDDLYKELTRFGNTVIRISTMTYFKREMIKNLFYEMFDEFVESQIQPFFNVERQYMPIAGKEEYAVDYRVSGKREVFLYAVKDTSKARLVTICEQTFLLNHIDTDSVVVYDDFSSIQSNDQKRILNATGKQYTSLDEFVNLGLAYMKKRLAS
ncbi:MAG TPA: DUF1828 domain-containing protein [Candidatus Cloacimonadota bacterium]|nr:DUF1828 domain-containing protein [Candidatus Cloacimonadota bacterium]